VHIRRAVPADRATVLRVFRAAGAAAWSHILPPEVLAGNELTELDERLAHMLVAEEEGEVVGFAVPRDGELDLLYTHPGVWGRGVGRALMDAALAVLAQQGFDEATLWTEERNERPRRVYERYGWKPDGTVRVRDYRGTELRELRYRIPLPLVPDLGTLSDAELRRLIRELERREHGVSFERRILHGRIAVLERELEVRRWVRELP
jgi:GNAT superfamily N-acetyltransferase